MNSQSLFNRMELVKIKTYTTSEVARIVNFHSNTIRRYEEWGLIPIPQRKANGYRIYTDYHIELIKTAKIAFQIEVLHSGLRKTMRSMIKALANYDFPLATILLDKYIELVNQEIARANEAILIVEAILKDVPTKKITSMKRSEAAHYLQVSVDTLRNWELNGLLSLKRLKNGYRVYHTEDIERLKIIRTLRSAKYSLEAILNLLNSLDRKESQDIRLVLNNNPSSEDIVAVCDVLIQSLETAKKNAISLKSNIILLKEISNKLKDKSHPE